MPYRVCVTRKSGLRETELEIHHGPHPEAGAEIEVLLSNGRVRARVGSPHTDPSKEGGRVVIEVHANEM